MDKAAVLAVVKPWFAKQGYELHENVPVNNDQIDLAVDKGEDRQLVVVMGDEDEPGQYAFNFDSGVGTIIAAKAQVSVKVQAALALAFSSTLAGLEHSYWRILRKYSNSIIFTDLDIHLLLVNNDGTVEDIVPSQVNNFLRNLHDRVIAAKGQPSSEETTDET